MRFSTRTGSNSGHRARRRVTRWGVIGAIVIGQLAVTAPAVFALPQTHCDIVGCNYPDSIPPSDKLIPPSADPVAIHNSGVTVSAGGHQGTAWYKGGECEIDPAPGACGLVVWGTDWSASNRVFSSFQVDYVINPQTGQVLYVTNQMYDALWDDFYVDAEKAGDAPFQVALSGTNWHYESGQQGTNESGAPHQVVTLRAIFSIIVATEVAVSRSGKDSRKSGAE